MVYFFILVSPLKFWLSWLVILFALLSILHKLAIHINLIFVSITYTECILYVKKIMHIIRAILQKSAYHYITHGVPNCRHWQRADNHRQSTRTWDISVEESSLEGPWAPRSLWTIHKPLKMTYITWKTATLLARILNTSLLMLSSSWSPAEFSH
jgi:hypothetical protein